MFLGPKQSPGFSPKSTGYSPQSGGYSPLPGGGYSTQTSGGFTTLPPGYRAPGAVQSQPQNYLPQDYHAPQKRRFDEAGVGKTDWTNKFDGPLPEVKNAFCIFMVFLLNIFWYGNLKVHK